MTEKKFRKFEIDERSFMNCLRHAWLFGFNDGCYIEGLKIKDMKLWADQYDLLVKEREVNLKEDLLEEFLEEGIMTYGDCNEDCECGQWELNNGYPVKSNESDI